MSTFFFISVFPFRGQPGGCTPAMPNLRGVPGASTTRLRLSHHEINMTQHSLRTITLPDSCYQLLKYIQ
jgi:hypothetical protein